MIEAMNKVLDVLKEIYNEDVLVVGLLKIAIVDVHTMQKENEELKAKLASCEKDWQIQNGDLAQCIAEWKWRGSEIERLKQEIMTLSGESE